MSCDMISEMGRLTHSEVKVAKGCVGLPKKWAGC